MHTDPAATPFIEDGAVETVLDIEGCQRVGPWHHGSTQYVERWNTSGWDRLFTPHHKIEGTNNTWERGSGDKPWRSYRRT